MSRNQDGLSWLQDQFYGGFSDDRFLGISQSFRYAKAVEIRKNPKSLTLAYNVETTTSTECDALANQIVTIQSTGDQIAFLANGKILHRTAGAGAWVLVYTHASNPAILNAIEYNDYLYWFTADYVHRIAISSITHSTWTPTLNFQAFTRGNANAHPAIELNNILYIGDSDYLSELDSFGAWTANRLAIFGDEEIRSLTFGGTMMRIFARKTNKIDGGHKYYWGGTNSSYDEKIHIKQIFHTAINIGGEDYIIAGLRPFLYLSSGYDLIDLKRIPLVYDDEQCFFSPNSMGFFDGLVCFAPAESGDASIGRGVWTYGRETKNYPNSLNFDYPTVNDNNTDVVGCVHNSAGVLMFSWKKDNGDSTYSYGIDYVNTGKFRASGSLHSRVMFGSRASKEKEVAAVVTSFDKLRAGEKIDLYLRKNLATTWPEDPEITIDYTDTDDRDVYSKEDDAAADIGDFNFLETKIVLTAGTGQLTTPELIEAEITFNEISKGE